METEERQAQVPWGTYLARGEPLLSVAGAPGNLGRRSPRLTAPNLCSVNMFAYPQVENNNGFACICKYMNGGAGAAHRLQNTE